MTDFSDALTFRSGVTVRNRLMMSPMTTVQSFWDGSLTRDEIDYYTERAEGLGAVITGAANVSDLGKGWNGELSIAHDSMIPGLSKLARSIQSQGAKAITQIFHAGRMTHSEVLRGHQIVSASDVAALRDDAETPRPLTVEEIHQTVADFGEATRRAIQAGFDGVELHGANTYLLQQFFSPHSNRRTDEYGNQSLENRSRFIFEVIDAVFAAVKKYATRPFLVGYRISPEEFETPGIRFADTLWLVRKLSETNLDYIHLSSNNYDRVARDPEYKEHPILHYVHEAVGSTPLVGIGGVRTRKDVEKVLEDTELVAVGQQLLYDPHWAVKLEKGLDDTMVTGSFKDLTEVSGFSHPLHDFQAARFTDTVLS